MRFLPTVAALVVVICVVPGGAASALFLAKSRSTGLKALTVMGSEQEGGVLQQLSSLENSAMTKLDQIEADFQAPNQVPPLTWKGYGLHLVVTWSVWVVLAAAAYFCCYRPMSPLPEKTVEKMPDDGEEQLGKLLTAGHWRCFDDSSICLCAFLCPSLRWADTTSLAGKLTFWTAFLAFTGLGLLNVAATGAVYGLFTACLILYFRQQLRDKLGVESGTFMTCCLDFFFVCCCPCCAIAQEARIVKEAIEMGHENFAAPSIAAATEAAPEG